MVMYSRHTEHTSGQTQSKQIQIIIIILFVINVQYPIVSAQSVPKYLGKHQITTEQQEKNLIIQQYKMQTANNKQFAMLFCLISFCCLLAILFLFFSLFFRITLIHQDL